MNKLLSLLNILEDTLLVIYNFFFRYSQIWWKKIGWQLNSPKGSSKEVVASTKWVKKQLWHFNNNSFDGDLVLRLFPLLLFPRLWNWIFPIYSIVAMVLRWRNVYRTSTILFLATTFCRSINVFSICIVLQDYGTPYLIYCNLLSGHQDGIKLMSVRSD